MEGVRASGVPWKTTARSGLLRDVEVLLKSAVNAIVTLRASARLPRNTIRHASGSPTRDPPYRVARYKIGKFDEILGDHQPRS